LRFVAFIDGKEESQLDATVMVY